jgi:tetratricopeptide (TPR) repeat protein
MKKAIYLFVIAALALANSATAQLRTPAPSPTAKFSQEVGLTKIEVEYSRPSAKGRKVFGDLVRFGEMWRTGANASTKFTSADDFMVGGVTVPKGTYALYTIPNKDSWSIIFYKNTSINGVPGDKFNRDDVAAQFDVRPSMAADAVETFTINLANVNNGGANLELAWENTRVVIPFTVPTDTKVMADIKTQMDGPSANTYYSAARYYLDEKKDLPTALEWVNKSLEKGGDKFWILRVKALILAELGRYKEAIEVAKKSTELATKEGNKDYPAMNEKSIMEWSKK